MPNAFNFLISPINSLSPDEQRLVQANVDVIHFQEGQIICAFAVSQIRCVKFGVQDTVICTPKPLRQHGLGQQLSAYTTSPS